MHDTRDAQTRFPPDARPLSNSKSESADRRARTSFESPRSLAQSIATLAPQTPPALTRKSPQFSDLSSRSRGRICANSPQISAIRRSHPISQAISHSNSGAEGQWFESTRAYHFSSRNSQVPTKSHCSRWTPVAVMCRKVGPRQSTKGGPERTGTVPGGHSGRAESGEAGALCRARFPELAGAAAHCSQSRRPRRNPFLPPRTRLQTPSARGCWDPHLAVFSARRVMLNPVEPSPSSPPLASAAVS